MKKNNAATKVTPIKKTNVLQTYRAIVDQEKELKKAKEVLKEEILALMDAAKSDVLALDGYKAERSFTYPVRLDTEAVKEFLGADLEKFQKKATEPTVTLKVI